MSSKSLFFRFLVFIFALFLFSGFILPAHYNIPYPAPLGPQFDPDIKKTNITEIDNYQPDLILIGDSVLYEGIDPALLTEELGVRSYSLAVAGSGTASWYLVMKNVILEAEYHPKYIVILFRNTMLTVPQYRTTGRYFELLDDFAGKNESLVTQLAFINEMSPLERFAERYVPIYSARLEIRQDLDNLIRYTPASIFGCNRNCTDDAVDSIFGREMDPVALNQMMEDAASTLFASKELDFDKQIDASFLPYMIQLAQRNNIELIFVRTKFFCPRPSKLAQYTASLDAYLTTQKDVYLIDYSDDPLVKDEYYKDSLHMNPYGQHEFTKIFADNLKRIIK